MQHQTGQLGLPLDHAPPRVRRHGYSDAHSRPLVGVVRGQRPNRQWRTFRTSPRLAWSYPYLELNPANSWSVFVFDCDDPARLLDVYPPFGGPSLLPEPSWRSYSQGGRAHVVYCLSTGDSVHKNRESARKPQIWAAAIAEHYATVLNADDAYAGILSRNPMAAPHRRTPVRTVWGRPAGYSLAALAEPLPEMQQEPALPAVELVRTHIGRNSTLFELCCKRFGPTRYKDVPVLPYAERVNAKFSWPMYWKEVADIARSIERYRKDWTYYEYSSAKQAERGVLSGKARRSAAAERNTKIIHLAGRNVSYREIGRMFKLTYGRVGQIVRAARP